MVYFSQIDDKMNFQSFCCVTSERGYEEAQLNDSRLKGFLDTLAHFSIHNLNDLLSYDEDFFEVADYTNVLECATR